MSCNYIQILSIIDIQNISYGIRHVFVHGSFACWNVLKCCMLKEVGQLLVEYNIFYILERLPGYADNWKKLDCVIRLQPKY